MTRQMVTTTVKEYDAKGKLVKETTTVTTYDWSPGTYVYPAHPHPYYHPYVTYTGGGNINYSTTAGCLTTTTTTVGEK